MQTDVAEIIFERVKILPIEKQREILHQVEIAENEESDSIWQKIRARAKSIYEKIWGEMPKDGSEQHDHNIVDIMNDKEFAKTYPSIDLAYEIAIDSYESLIKRIDGADSRLQTMLTFSLSLLVAVPTLAKLREISFDSVYFIGGVIV
jgi:hypothetical protein